MAFTCSTELEDNIKMDLQAWPIIKTSDFISAYVFDDQKLSNVWETSIHEPEMRPDLAEAYLKIWRQINAVWQTNTLVGHLHDRCFVVSCHGNLIVEGKARLNLGLLFRNLSAVPSKPILTTDIPALAFSSKDRQVLWRILERIGRSEVPRRIELDIGGDITSIDASAKGFDLVAGAKDLTKLVDGVRKAVKAKAEVRYSLGDRDAAESAAYQLSHFIAAVNGAETPVSDSWQFTDDGWPVSCPSDTRFEQLRSVTMAVAIRLQDVPGRGRQQLQLFDLADELTAKITSKDGATSVWFADKIPG